MKKEEKFIENDITKSASELQSGYEELKSSLNLPDQEIASESDCPENVADTNDLFSGQFPEVPDDEGDYGYTVIDGNEIKITRYLGIKQDPVIPRYIDGHQVTIIGDHAFFVTDIESVSIPEGVLTIESEAFAGCEELTKVVLPSTLKNFGKGAFMGCEMLRDVLFRGKNSDFTVKDGIVYDLKQRKLLLCPPGLELRRVDVEPGTVIIGACAFYSNNTLEIVNLPMTVRIIEDSAFLFTRLLRIIELPPYIEEIADNAFLVGKPPFQEKHFGIYAFPNTYAYQYAEKNQIPVNPLYGILTG